MTRQLRYIGVFKAHKNVEFLWAMIIAMKNFLGQVVGPQII